MAREALTILLVEDDELLMMSFSDMLRDMGHEVFEAPTAAQALTMLMGNSDIDVLITDIQMPDMNGQELVRRMRQIRADLPVIYSSGHRRDVVDDLDADACARFLEKPFGPNEVVAVFRSLSVDEAA